MPDDQDKKRLGYGRLEEEILENFNPYMAMPDCNAETFWRSTPPHERIIDPVALSEAVDTFMKAERELLEKKKKEIESSPKIVIRKGDLEKFREETGLRPWEAEEYFVLSNGDLEEALLIWVNQMPGTLPKKLSSHEKPVRLIKVEDEKLVNKDHLTY